MRKDIARQTPKRKKVTNETPERKQADQHTPEPKEAVKSNAAKQTTELKKESKQATKREKAAETDGGQDKRPGAQPTGGRFFQTVAEVLEVLGVSMQTWSRWRQEEGFPTRKGQGWDLAELLEWQREKWRKDLSRIPEGEAEKKEKLLEQQIEINTFKIDELRGEVDRKIERALLEQANLNRRLYEDVLNDLKAKRFGQRAVQLFEKAMERGFKKHAQRLKEAF